MNTETLIKKYKRYISNVQWHIDTNKPLGSKVMELQDRIKDWQEVVNDLEASATLTATPSTNDVQDFLLADREKQSKECDCERCIQMRKENTSTDQRSAEDVESFLKEKLDHLKECKVLIRFTIEDVCNIVRQFASQFRSSPSADDNDTLDIKGNAELSDVLLTGKVVEWAEASALKSSTDCDEGNHSFDCFCSAHEEGYIKGFAKAKEILVPATPPTASGEQLQSERAYEGMYKELLSRVKVLITEPDGLVRSTMQASILNGMIDDVGIIVSESASLVKEVGKDQAEHAPSQVKEGTAPEASVTAGEKKELILGNLYRWVNGNKRLPEPDGYDYPTEYLYRIKGDDPRSGWAAVGQATVEEMRSFNDDYWEWQEKVTMPLLPVTSEQEEKLQYDTALTECMAGRDGECNHSKCPVSEEDVKNGKYCHLPLYDWRQ